MNTTTDSLTSLLIQFEQDGAANRREELIPRINDYLAATGNEQLAEAFHIMLGVILNAGMPKREKTIITKTMEDLQMVLKEYRSWGDEQLEKGRAEGETTMLRNAMNKHGWTPTQTFDFFDIPESSRAKYSL